MKKFKKRYMVGNEVLMNNKLLKKANKIARWESVGAERGSENINGHWIHTKWVR
jgi:hypothetical protein